MPCINSVFYSQACRKRNKRSHNLAFLDVYENYGIAMEEVQVGKSNMNHQEDD